METHFVCSWSLVLVPSAGFPPGTARCFRPSFLLPVVFVLATSAFPSWAGSCVGWQLSLGLVSAFCGTCFDAASFSCVFLAWYIKAAKVDWCEPQVNTRAWITVLIPQASTFLTVCADIVWHLQQVSIFHPSCSHIQGTLVACGGWRTQMNIRDSDTSLDLSWCMSSQTAEKRKTHSCFSAVIIH